jgi:hypothetical protein
MINYFLVRLFLIQSCEGGDPKGGPRANVVSKGDARARLFWGKVADWVYEMGEVSVLRVARKGTLHLRGGLKL